MTQQLVRIGDRIIDLNAVTHANYDQESVDIADMETKPLCAVSFGFGCDEFQLFYGVEADLVWELLIAHALNLTPTGGNAA